MLAACDSEQAARQRANEAKAKETEKARVEQECHTVQQALVILASRGRKDLTQPEHGLIDVCNPFDVEGCGYKVEVMLELDAAGSIQLGERIQSIGINCQDEFKFAKRFGLEAFREHRKLLEAAVEDALAEDEAARDAATEAR